MNVARRTGVAAILAGLLLFAGIGGELAFGDDSDILLFAEVLLAGLGIASLAVSLWGLRSLSPVTRPGRIGINLALAGSGLLAIFAVVALIGVILNGKVPDVFVLFGLGFLLLIVGILVFAPGLRRAPVFGRAWILPLVAVAGVLAAIVISADPFHDIGLVVFEAAWVAFGIALLRVARTPG